MRSTVEHGLDHRLSEETRYRLLTYLAEHPDASQRDVAAQLGISVGKVNYCFRALMAKGWLKMRNFRRSDNKWAYVYVLTPRGVEEKLNVTAEFLRLKITEYDALALEIEKVTAGLRAAGVNPDAAVDERAS